MKDKVFLSLGLACTFAAGTVHAQPAPAPGQPAAAAAQLAPAPGEGVARPADAQGQIEQDMQGFLDVVNNQDLLYAARYVQNARRGYFGAEEWLAQLSNDNGNRDLQLVSVKIDRQDGDDAWVSVSLALARQPAQGAAAATQQPLGGGPEKLHLHRGVDSTDKANTNAPVQTWKIAVDDDNNAIQWHNQMAAAAYALRQSRGSLPVLRQHMALERVGALGLAAMQFLQDYENRLVFDAAHYQDALFPYVGGIDYFSVPGTQDTFSINPKLCGLGANEIAAADKTILFYDGHDQALNYRFSGKAAVAMADGHAELVSPDEAKALRWEP